MISALAKPFFEKNGESNFEKCLVSQPCSFRYLSLVISNRNEPMLMDEWLLEWMRCDPDSPLPQCLSLNVEYDSALDQHARRQEVFFQLIAV